MKIDMIDSADAQEQNGGSSAGCKGKAWAGTSKNDVGGGEYKDIMELKKTKSEGAGEEIGNWRVRIRTIEEK